MSKKLPAVAFTRGRRLSDADSLALTFPPGWQTERYRGVVLAWTIAAAEASDLDLGGYRAQGCALPGRLEASAVR